MYFISFIAIPDVKTLSRGPYAGLSKTRIGRNVTFPIND